MILNLNFACRQMSDDPRVTVPEFTRSIPGGATENEEDEHEILENQDLTEKINFAEDDENMGAKSVSLDSLEDEPEDFLEGEVDVKEQMDRAADAMDSSLRGLQNQSYEDSPQRELGASFEDTPGGLEEVAMKTDQDLARLHHGGKKTPKH